MNVKTIKMLTCPQERKKKKKIDIHSHIDYQFFDRREKHDLLSSKMPRFSRIIQPQERVVSSTNYRIKDVVKFPKYFFNYS